MDQFAEAIELCLSMVQEVTDSLPIPGDKRLDSARERYERLQWIERQLNSLLNKLTSLQDDLTAGLSIVEMGFSDPQELGDMLADMTAQIQQLKAMRLSLALGIRR